MAKSNSKVKIKTCAIHFGSAKPNPCESMCLREREKTKQERVANMSTPTIGCPFVQNTQSLTFAKPKGWTTTQGHWRSSSIDDLTQHTVNPTNMPMDGSTGMKNALTLICVSLDVDAHLCAEIRFYLIAYVILDTHARA